VNETKKALGRHSPYLRSVESSPVLAQNNYTKSVSLKGQQRKVKAQPKRRRPLLSCRGSQELIGLEFAPEQPFPTRCSQPIAFHFRQEYAPRQRPRTQVLGDQQQITKDERWRQARRE